MKTIQDFLGHDETIEDYMCVMLLLDAYKLYHRPMYKNGMEYISATWTPRATRMRGVDHVLTAGNQAAIKHWLIGSFNKYFFKKDIEEICFKYNRVMKFAFGEEKVDDAHIRALHKLGYLPLSIKALPEGTLIPLRVPALTITNTHPDFFWLPNYFETLLSSELWPTYTAATISLEYRKILNAYAMKTVGNTDFVKYQGHDFSMRGMMGFYAAMLTGLGHAINFEGSDTVPVIFSAEFFYNANIEKEMVITSIPASEHSIECSYEDDYEYFLELITKKFPSGPVSLVSDGRDFWDVTCNVIPKLKDAILARKGHKYGLDKVVIRPDSGDPVLIICGDPSAPAGTPANKGAVRILWEIFGGTTTDKGYKLLDSHIGLIYGDAITLARCSEICKRLEEMGFASINVVFGIGSYTYQYNTRDTFGFALKTTAAVMNGVEMQIFKDPKTDNGIKKSQKGRVAVLKDGDSFKFIDGLKLSDKIEGDLLQEIFRDGKMVIDDSLSAIRERAAKYRNF